MLVEIADEKLMARRATVSWDGMKSAQLTLSRRESIIIKDVLYFLINAFARGLADSDREIIADI